MTFYNLKTSIYLYCCCITAVFILFHGQVLKSQVVINEVMVMPSTDGTSAQFQSMYNTTAGFGAEWIELYNTDPCNAANISCFSIGGMDGGLNGGLFSFPAGTTIPPRGHIVIGGPNATNVNFNLSTFLPANGTANLWGSSASRWHMPNGDGWVILYNASGALVDGVYWYFSTSDPANKITTDGTFVSTMTRPTACGGGTLSDARTNLANMEFIPHTTTMGSTFARSVDGGSTWIKTATPTARNCNAACATCSFLENKIISFNGNCEGIYKSFKLVMEDPQISEIEIEHSKNGIDFELLEKMNVNTGQTAFEIKDLQSTKEYFRAKLLSNEGLNLYTDLLNVNCPGLNGEFNVYPNPATDIINIGFGSEIGRNCRFLIYMYNMLGQEVKTVFLTHDTKKVLPVNIQNLIPGTYVLKIKNDENGISFPLKKFEIK
jgi:hypothetical protein